MQKYKSNLTSVSGAAVRGASVTVLDESGATASIFLDRAGILPAGNPLKTGQDGTFEFYAANGRYSLRTDSSGLNVLEEDVILMFDPDDATVSGPIADAIQDAKDAAGAAQESADRAQQIVVNTVPTFGTYALAVLALDSVQDDMRIEISQDETRAGSRTRYFKRTGDVLEFSVNLDQLRIDLSEAGGAARVEFDGGTVQDVLDDAKPLPDYVALRNYSGRANGVRLTNRDIGGYFQRDDSDTTSLDNGGTLIVATGGVRWKRKYDSVIEINWFTTGYSDHADRIEVALAESAAKRKVANFDGPYTISRTITIPLGATTTSVRRSDIKPVSGTTFGPAVIYAPGNMRGRHILPSFVGFTGSVLDVRCSLLDLYVPEFNGNEGVCVKFNSGVGGNPSNVLDSVVRVDAISNCLTAVEFSNGTTTDIMQGCGVYFNFITNTTNCVVFTGVNPSNANDGLFIDGLAIDFTSGRAGGFFLSNAQSSGAVSRFTAKVRSWFGGRGFEVENPTQFAIGNFNAALLDIVNARGFDFSHYAANTLRSSGIYFRNTSSSTNALRMVTVAEGLPAFNAGKPIHNDSFMLKFELRVDVPPQGSTSQYFFHTFGDVDYQLFEATPLQGAGTLVIAVVQDQSSVERGRVLVTLANVGSAPVVAGTIKFIRVRRRG